MHGDESGCRIGMMRRAIRGARGACAAAEADAIAMTRERTRQYLQRVRICFAHAGIAAFIRSHETPRPRRFRSWHGVC